MCDGYNASDDTHFISFEWSGEIIDSWIFYLISFCSPPGLRFEFMVYEATTMDAGMSNAGLFSVPVTVICS